MPKWSDQLAHINYFLMELLLDIISFLHVLSVNRVHTGGRTANKSLAAFWTSFLLKNKLNSASQNINFSSFPSPFLWEYITVCKLFLSVLCPSAVFVSSQRLSTIRHNQGSEFPLQLPGKVLEVVTYNVNLEIWTTTQRKAEKVSLHIFSVHKYN